MTIEEAKNYIKNDIRIYLMKDGQVVESGTHEELISLNGYYHEMFTLQAENYQESLPEEMLRGAEAFYG